MSNCLWSTELYYHKWSLWVQTSCSSSTWCCFFLSVGSIIRLYSVHSQFYSSKVPHTRAFSAPRADLVEVQCKVKRCCKTWASCFNIYSRAMQFTHQHRIIFFSTVFVFSVRDAVIYLCNVFESEGWISLWAYQVIHRNTCYKLPWNLILSPMHQCVDAADLNHSSEMLPDDKY